MQLATNHWACIIDVLTLRNEISEELWKIFFTYLFKERKLIGFSSRNELKYLITTFPKLNEFFQEQSIFCLQKFSSEIIKKTPDEKSKVFPCFIEIPSGSGMAVLAKAILNIYLDKSEQTSDWVHRPLSESQQNYAFFDAIVPILIYDEIKYNVYKIFS